MLFIAAGFFALPAQTFAQVATASIDPTQPSISGAATGWKKDRVVFGSYFTGSGARNFEKQDIYEFTRSGNVAGITLPWGPMVVEGSALNWSQQTSISKRYNGGIPISVNGSRAHVALNHDGWASIGVSSVIKKTTNYVNIDVPEEIKTANGIGGSLALSLMENYFIGAGTNNVRSTGDDMVDNKWKETQVGVGVRFGMKGGFQFRAEAATVKSDRAESKAFGEFVANIHFAEETEFNQVEMSINGLIFSFKGSKKTVFADIVVAEGADPIDSVVTEVGESGVLWVPQDGLVLGFYFVSEKTTEVFEDTHNIFKVQSAYVF